MLYPYFSDREAGPRPRAVEGIDDTLWGAILALLYRGIDGAWFAEDFPTVCEDSKGIYACDQDGLIATVRAEIPDLGYFSQRPTPPTLAILDLLEFMHRHACAVRDGKYHSFFDHRHLLFDRDEGQRELRSTINRLLARSGVVYEDERGCVQRVVPAAVAVPIRRELPATIDRGFDELLDTAARRFLDPDPEVRRDALEKLWDAFERSKTMLDADKKRGAEQLVAAATSGTAPEETDLLREEMKTLTEIGNTFRIRHHETPTIPLSIELVDQLFSRMYALLLRVHAALQ